MELIVLNTESCSSLFLPLSQGSPKLHFFLGNSWFFFGNHK